MRSRPLALSLLALALAGSTLLAEEGMWTFDNLPTKKIQETYGWAPDQAWLDHVRLSSLRFGGGCSASFVSADGLVLTNHHCGRDYVQRLSSKDRDYILNGFAAASRDQEIQIPGLEMRTLMAMADITARLNKAIPSGTSEKDLLKLRGAEIEKIKKEMQDKSGLVCEHVSLYQGGEHWIYSYKKHTDVRLVFAPEQQLAGFGGDFDNFTYPRHSLDFSLFRAYENGKPYKPPHFLTYSKTSLKAGDLTFITGHPGRTSRQETHAQMVYARDVALPQMLKGLERRKEALVQYGKTSPEAARRVSTQILGIENGLKARSGYLAGLRNQEALARVQAAENDLRGRVDMDPKLKAEAGPSWSRIAQAMAAAKDLLKDNTYIGTASSTLLGHALSIVRIVEQEALPSEARLPEYSDASLKTLKARLGIPAPFHRDLEIFLFTRSLAEAARELGPEHPYVKAMLGGKSAAEVAKAAVEGSKLAAPEVRKALVAGGRPAMEASQDPMLLLARKLDPLSRAQRRKQEDQVQSVLAEHGARIAKARFAVYGKHSYPDATSTLRLTYGVVDGFKANGTLVQPFTTLGGLYDRHDGWGGNAAMVWDGAWALPQRWLDKRNALDLSVPFNFVHRVDIIGGNSGSPVVNRQGELVGVVFDGNIDMLPGNFYYDGSANRGVSLDARAIVHALDKVYGAKHLVAELTGK